MLKEVLIAAVIVEVVNVAFVRRGWRSIGLLQGNFEDARCRCVCPSTKYFAAENRSVSDERRYYTKSNINALTCNPQTVVKPNVLNIVDAAHLDAFLANCDCKHESRNTVLLKVVVIFVICIVFVLVTYMLFLMCLDPMLRKQRQSVPYRQQTDEVCNFNTMQLYFLFSSSV
ncbi:unnamed protein product [Gongylonema pulchrum]|uniref:TMEM9 protein n=1 Tax=Gongylonema pulchrum TaxID=637853 RepID=A0A183EIS9_9BILA|nr:unnamed protein product [Gongylonema pulchrum]